MIKHTPVMIKDVYEQINDKGIHFELKDGSFFCLEDDELVLIDNQGNYLQFKWNEYFEGEYIDSLAMCVKEVGEKILDWLRQQRIDAFDNIKKLDEKIKYQEESLKQLEGRIIK